MFDMSEEFSKRFAQDEATCGGVGQSEGWSLECDLQLLEITPAATLVVDTFGQIFRANQRAFELLKPSGNILLGTALRDYLLADSAEAFKHFFARLRESEGVQTCEMRLKTGANDVLQVLMQAKVVPKDGGQLLVFTLNDITEWRSADPESILIEERLRHSQKMEALGRLSAGVVHDFNNILTIITGYSRIVLDELEGSPERQHLQKIAHASGRAADLVSKMLLFARGEESGCERVLNLNDRVIAFEDLFKSLVSDEIRLEALLEPNLANIRADANQIDQVLMNLAMNARDAMDGSGVLSFETSVRFIGSDRPRHLAHLTPGQYVELRVCDTGCGMTPEDAERAFRPFFSTKGVGHGTGLGLATVRSIMHECGGEVELTTAPREGSCFALLFPAADSSIDNFSESLGFVMNMECEGTHIFVVNENPEVRELIVYVMEKQGYCVTQSCPTEALDKAQQAASPFTMVVIDRNLPKPLSRELLGGLRGLHPSIKTLFLSSQRTPSIFELGSAELQKPFTSHELCYAVQDLLNT
ncbi:signal transduction histidine kinase [Bradymonas sediminis]|uniref:histidine kinase n=2 Tax=Bradymonas sediminis TaxID=1548548 RepID=A0A2Z4FIZ7_9DELT|nr:hypothetical protein DN745_06440 [Bradymonas sediminis]TDP72010.1 signal transduction histidine kinase [Bradymonas sediminis]